LRISGTNPIITIIFLVISLILIVDPAKTFQSLLRNYIFSTQ
jgi:hypothetical protein